MSGVEEWLVQNRDKLEKGVEIMSQASSVLASTVGQLHPVLEAVFQVSAVLLKDPTSGEASYLTQQLTKVNDQLSAIQNEIGQIELEMMTSSMNKQNFDWEVHILSQFEQFQDFIKAKQEYKAKRKEKFVKHYEITGRDLNVEALYNAVVEESASQRSILETVLVTQEKSRRPVEEFCARLKKLFVVGIISVMAHSAFKEETVDAEVVKKWKGRMEKVEDKMKAAIDDCVENFAEQAKVDLSKKLDENSGPIDPDLAKSLLEALAKKYDWVSWSVRAFKHRERIFFFNWLAGKKYHGSKGNNWFDFLTKSKVKVVVSFCTEPKPIDKSRIQELIEQTKLNRNMMSVALALHDAFPDYLIHAVSHYKTVQEANNFPVDCLYFTRYKGAYLCFHSQ